MLSIHVNGVLQRDTYLFHVTGPCLLDEGRVEEEEKGSQLDSSQVEAGRTGTRLPVFVVVKRADDKQDRRT